MDLTKALLTWFDAQKRDLPWRGAKDPYRVWLSEIMLQQTTVAAVIPYFEAFTTRWPDVEALASAKDDEVMAAWAGLGYYARARNLLKCARAVADLGGQFPETQAGLQALPGIGPYTSAAIAAIAFKEPVAAVDGNVIRVFSRLHALDTPLPKVKDAVQPLAQGLVPKERPGDYVEATMELGATVCRPKNPDCQACPWAGACKAHGEGQPLAYPVRAPKKPKPTRSGWAFVIRDQAGHVLLEKRPDQGLLGGMTGFPGTPWAETTAQDGLALAQQAFPWVDSWQEATSTVTHTFTHFHLELRVLVGQAATRGNAGERAFWTEDLDVSALPTVMKKVYRAV